MFNSPYRWYISATLILLLALASMNIAYGYWTESLQVTGTLQTGSLDAQWDRVQCTEYTAWPIRPGTPEGEPGGVSYATTHTAWEPGDSSLVYVNISNGYPGYTVVCSLDFSNSGTLPWKITGNSLYPGTNLTGCTVNSTASPKTMECDQLTAVFRDNVGVQFDPDGGGTSSLTIHIKDGAVQHTDYGFSMRACLSQWNSGMDFGACMATLH